MDILIHYIRLLEPYRNKLDLIDNSSSTCVKEIFGNIENVKDKYIDAVNEIPDIINCSIQVYRYIVMHEIPKEDCNYQLTNKLVKLNNNVKLLTSLCNKLESMTKYLNRRDLDLIEEIRFNSSSNIYISDLCYYYEVEEIDRQIEEVVSSLYRINRCKNIFRKYINKLLKEIYKPNNRLCIKLMNEVL